MQRALTRKGFLIWDRNWRCRLGEIDIVASLGRELYFIEVKTRAQHVAQRFAPETAITSEKLDHMAATMQWYVDENVSRRRRARISSTRLMVAAVVDRGWWRGMQITYARR